MVGEGCFLRPLLSMGGVDSLDEFIEENDTLCMLLVLILCTEVGQEALDVVTYMGGAV